MRTILIADDNPISRELIREILDPSEYRVVEAASGREALELVSAAVPDLLVLDLQMPDLDGLNVVRILRQETRYAHLPILALTALAMSEDRERALAAGFDEFITKPVRPAFLRSQIRRLLSLSEDRPGENPSHPAKKESHE
jgi:CheY-like chemotaxis protein